MYVTQAPPCPCFAGGYLFNNILSISVWLFYIGSGWLSLAYPKLAEGCFMHWLTRSSKTKRYTYMDLYYLFHEVCFIGNLLFATTFIGIYFYNVVVNQVEFLSIYFQNTYTTYTAVPLISVSILFILGETYYGVDVQDEEGGEPREPSDGDLIYWADYLLTFIALSTMFFIYLRPGYGENTRYSYIKILTKKGTYACLISLLIFNVFYNTQAYMIYKEVSETVITGSTYAFCVIIPLINIFYAKAYFDWVLSIMGALIEIGLGIQLVSKDLGEKTINVAGYISFFFALVLLGVLMVNLRIAGSFNQLLYNY